MYPTRTGDDDRVDVIGTYMVASWYTHCTFDFQASKSKSSSYLTLPSLDMDKKAGSSVAAVSAGPALGLERWRSSDAAFCLSLRWRVKELPGVWFAPAWLRGVVWFDE
jgi:hypothetical protein